MCRVDQVMTHGVLNPWWRHQMETPGYWPLGEFPSQKPVSRSFNVFFDLRPNKRLSKNREAGDLGRHCAHYAAIVMPGKLDKMLGKEYPGPSN